MANRKSRQSGKNRRPQAAKPRDRKPKNSKEN
jgi:hypothetical protein